MRDGWSSIIVRLEGPDPRVLQAIPEDLLSLGTLSPNATVLLIPVDTGGEKRLDDRLDSLREFLLVNEGALVQASESCSPDVFIGWSPASPQEALTLDASLLETLARFRMDLVFDTYSE